jgi:hypothetical protein
MSDLDAQIRAMDEAAVPNPERVLVVSPETAANIRRAYPGGASLPIAGSTQGFVGEYNGVKIHVATHLPS